MSRISSRTPNPRRADCCSGFCSHLWRRSRSSRPVRRRRRRRRRRPIPARPTPARPRAAALATRASGCSSPTAPPRPAGRPTTGATSARRSRRPASSTPSSTPRATLRQQQSQAEQAIADGAGVVVLVEHRHRLRRHDHRPGQGGRRPGGRVRPLQHRRLRRRRLRQLRQRRGRRDDGRGLEPVIDALDVDEAGVVMLNGGEEDNNSFLFRDGYAATVEASAWTPATGRSSPTSTSPAGAPTARGSRSWSRSSPTRTTRSTPCSRPTTTSPSRRSTLSRPRASGRSRERPGRERGRDAEHPPRQPDDERLQAVPGRGRGRGRRRAGAVRRRGLPGTRPYESDARIRCSVIDHRDRRGHRGGDRLARGRRRRSLRGPGAHRRHRREHRRHRDRRRVPHHRGDLHRRHGRDGLLPGERLNRPKGRRGRLRASPPPRRRMAMAETPLLECRSVSKAFGAVQALYNVDFEVDRGEVMALVGDNGAGKSTLIKSIAGIYPFDEGEVFFDGQARQRPRAS